LHGQFSLAQTHIEVFPRRPGFLNPLPLNSDAVGHGKQFFRRVGNHVAHSHAAKRSAVGIDIDCHLPSLSLCAIYRKFVIKL
jgi:hypothetical protein